MIRMRSLLSDFLPEVVVGTGGYASALPLYMASRKSEPFPLFFKNKILTQV
jgi:UDP-N-acetylglucosamine:LPS N-acetylglucosamine transferase